MNTTRRQENVCHQKALIFWCRQQPNSNMQIHLHLASFNQITSNSSKEKNKQAISDFKRLKIYSNFFPPFSPTEENKNLKLNCHTILLPRLKV